MLILTHFAYIDGRASRFWPGAHEVDIVGADGYNTGGCREARASHAHFTTGKTPPETPASLFGRVVRFAASHGSLPVFIAEWGSVAYSDANVRVNWIHQMQAFVQANPEITAALYWDSQVPPCDYILNNSPSSLVGAGQPGPVAAHAGQASGLSRRETPTGPGTTRSAPGPVRLPGKVCAGAFPGRLARQDKRFWSAQPRFESSPGSQAPPTALRTTVAMARCATCPMM